MKFVHFSKFTNSQETVMIKLTLQFNVALICGSNQKIFKEITEYMTVISRGKDIPA